MSLPSDTPDSGVGPVSYEDLAGRMDHHLLQPDFHDEDVAKGCRLAVSLGTATVLVRPSDADLAVRLLEGTAVKPASVVGFPHGSATTGVKLYEARDLLRRGIREIEAVMNLGKLLSRQFQYVEMELMQLAKACRDEGAFLKVVLENAYLTEDLKIIACKVCKRAEASFAVTATGFAPGVPLLADLPLMKRTLKDYCEIKASCIQTLDDALEALRLGATRLGTTDSSAILAAWKAQLEIQSASGAAPT